MVRYYDLDSVKDNLRRYYSSYDIKVNPSEPFSFESFVDRETHHLLSSTGLFRWDNKKVFLKVFHLKVINTAEIK